MGCRNGIDWWDLLGVFGRRGAMTGWSSVGSPNTWAKGTEVVDLCARKGAGTETFRGLRGAGKGTGRGLSLPEMKRDCRKVFCGGLSGWPFQLALDFDMCFSL